MIDIHSHIIPNVDDGSPNLEVSISILEEEIANGVTDIICTPHYCSDKFETSVDDIKKNFEKLKKRVEELKMQINLYLGQEIFCKRAKEIQEYFSNEKIMFLNNTNYLLLEFPYIHKTDINEIIYSCHLHGWKVIVAHIERYEYINIDDIYEMKNTGALIQMNASTVIGQNGSKMKKYAHQLLKNKLVDFIASDIHASRKNYLAVAKKYIEKKYGTDYCEELFQIKAHQTLNIK